MEVGCLHNPMGIIFAYNYILYDVFSKENLSFFSHILRGKPRFSPFSRLFCVIGSEIYLE